MAAVGEHGELDAGRAAVVEQRLDRGADRAPGEEDVVDDDDRARVDVEVQVRRVDDGRAAAGRDVVAVEGDVEVAERDVDVVQLGDEALQALGEHGAAAVDADEREPLRVAAVLDDLVRDARERPAHVLAVEDDLRFWHRVLPGLTGPG